MTYFLLQCTINWHTVVWYHLPFLTMNCLMAPQEVIHRYLSSGLFPSIPILSKTKTINRSMFQKNLQWGNSFSMTHFWTYAPVVKGSSLYTGKSASYLWQSYFWQSWQEAKFKFWDSPNVELLPMLIPPHNFHFHGVFNLFFWKGHSNHYVCNQWFNGTVIVILVVVIIVLFLLLITVMYCSWELSFIHIIVILLLLDFNIGFLYLSFCFLLLLLLVLFLHVLFWQLSIFLPRPLVMVSVKSR